MYQSLIRAVQTTCRLVPSFPHPACLLLPLLFLILPIDHASADFYTYKDGAGMVHMTNKLDTVPQKYRATMKVTKEDPPKAAPAASGPAEESPPPAAAREATTQRKTEGAAEKTGTRPWVKAVAVVAGIIAALFIVVRLARLLPSPHLTRLVYLSFFLGIFLFAYTAYARHLVDGYFTMKTKVLTMFKKSNQREESPAERKAGEAEGEQPAAAERPEQRNRL